MISNTLTARISTTTASNATAATVAVVTAGGFLALLGLMHVLKPELSPTWRVVSEYEIGRHGWLMSAAFILLAVACLATARAIAPITADRAGRIGRGALCMTAGGLVLAAFATADPVTATTDQLTTHGNLHGLGALIGIPAFVVAAVALSASVGRRHWPTGLRAATAAVGAAVVVYGVSMAVMFDGAPSTPDVRLGIQNRVLVVAYAAWLIVAARVAVRTTQPR